MQSSKMSTRRPLGTAVAVAAVLSTLATVQKAQDHNQQASASIAKAIQLRSTPGVITEELAKDSTLAGAIQRSMGESQAAKNYYLQAIAFWGALPASGLQILTALDPLASLYRDESNYSSAEEMYMWALHLREAALGPKDSELISTLD
jgi:tetratricopeptide (TPR) repeat protein